MKKIIFSFILTIMVSVPAATVFAQDGGAGISRSNTAAKYDNNTGNSGNDIRMKTELQEKGLGPVTTNVQNKSEDAVSQSNEADRQELTTSYNHAASKTEGYDPQQQGKDSDSDGSIIEWIALFVALVGLGAASYNYSTLRPKKSRTRSARQERQQAQADIKESNQLKAIIKQNNTFSATINQLNGRITELENRMAGMSAQFSASVPNNQNNARNYRPETTVQASDTGSSLTLYATVVMSDGFPEADLTDTNSNYVIAVLTVKGDTGTFVINELATAQSSLISNFSYGAGRICDILQQVDSPTKVQTVNPGTIHRQGNSWRVTSNALVKLV